MKAYIITMSNHAESLRMSKVLKESILKTDSEIQAEHFEAVQPPQLYQHIIDIFGEHVAWTWPKTDAENRLDFATNLYMRKYEAFDQNRVIACALSHFKLWKKCADEKETIMILEHDAVFNWKFEEKDILWDASWGAIGLNDPRGNTRKGQLFNTMIENDFSDIQKIPLIDGGDEMPLPMGLAGNSAYVMRPHAAKEVLAKIKEVGMWPNDAILCRQLFPWLRVTKKYYTTTQRNVSTTTQVA